MRPLPCPETVTAQATWLLQGGRGVRLPEVLFILAKTAYIHPNKTQTRISRERKTKSYTAFTTNKFQASQG